MKLILPLAMAAFALTAVGAQAATATKVNGWISDSMCRAKHMGTGAACVRKCIQNGMKPVFVDTKKQVWSIDNPSAVKNFYGDHVKVTATEDASAKSMHIDSIAAAK